MNNHSIIRLIALFFLLIFALINGLFWIANQHFSKEQEEDRMRRFALAERLIHHKSGSFDAELMQLMVAPSSLSPDFLQSHGKSVAEFPFGKMLRYNGKVYFVKSLPPRFPFPPPPPMFDHVLPPPPPMGDFSPIVVECVERYDRH